MKQPANFGEERGLYGASVDVVSKVLHSRTEAIVKIIWGGVIGHQNTNMHPICNML